MRTLILSATLAAFSATSLAQTATPAQPATPAMPAPATPMTPINMGSAMMNGKIPASGTVDVNGAKVYFKSVGSGKPMMLIHGYPLSGELFKDNRAALATRGNRR